MSGVNKQAFSNNKSYQVPGFTCKKYSVSEGVVQNRRRKGTITMRTITTEPVLSGHHPHYSPIARLSTCAKMY